jgi:hypothetical protein
MRRWRPEGGRCARRGEPGAGLQERRAQARQFAKDLNGNIVGEDQAGVHATSPDGIDWCLSEPAKAYSRHITWSDGRQETLGCFERPQLLLKNGVPTHIFAAASDGPGGFNHATRTWNIVVPLMS